MLIILIGFIVVAGLQWFIIKRIPIRILRVLIQIPLLVVTILITMGLLARENIQADIAEQENFQASILDSAIVGRGDLVVTVSATGSIIPNRQTPLTFSLSNAPVDQINVVQGDAVTEGQVLASLLSTDFQQAVEDATIAFDIQQLSFDTLTNPATEQDLAVAQAQLEAANAQLTAATISGTVFIDNEIAALQAEIARNQLWQLQLQRDALAGNPPQPLNIPTGNLPDDVQDVVNDTIGNVNASSQAQYDAQVRQAENIVIQGEFGVDIADANVTSTAQRTADPGSVAAANAAVIQAELALDQLINGPDDLQLQQANIELELARLNLELAQSNLGQTQLIAPFDGIVAQINLTQNELPPQGVSVLLIDDSAYYVELPIDETDIAQIAIGQSVTFEVDALPDKVVTGQVSSIAYAPLSTQDAALVAYNVRVDIDTESATDIRPGMTVTGSITTIERDDVLVVRNNFIRIDRITGEAFVTVRAVDGSTEERLIVLGDRNDSLSEVNEGLSVGEEVILLPRTDEADTAFGG